MKGAIKFEEIDGKNFEIKKCGATEALEAQSIFYKLIIDSGIPMDNEVAYSKLETYMMKALTRDVVSRIKQVFINTIVTPKITDDNFDDMDPSIITTLFLKVYEYQTGEADKKKDPPNSSTESQTNSEMKK